MTFICKQQMITITIQRFQEKEKNDQTHKYLLSVNKKLRNE
jgi:hypothetical protein